MTDPAAAAFWLFRHTLFGDDVGYKRVLARAGKPTSALLVHAQAVCKKWAATRSKQFDRVRLARAIEERAARVR